MNRITLPVVALALFVSACGDDLDKGTQLPAEVELTNQAKADGHSPYQGELAVDEGVAGDLSRWLPYHLWSLELESDTDVFLDLASRSGGDTFLVVYQRTDRGWTYVDHNDDCRGSRNSCLETRLEAGTWLLLASSYNFMARGRAAALDYTLNAHCAGDCAAPGEVLCGSRGLAPCAEGTFCDWPDDSCGAVDAPGTCQPRPEACIQVYDPVCGCDGRTHGNACSAASAGVDIVHVGPCPRPRHGVGEICGGIAGFQCEEGLVCDMSGNAFCGADLAGTCAEPSEILCAQLYDPVCGCDGRTYGNDCMRRGAMVPLDHVGECAQ